MAAVAVSLCCDEISTAVAATATATVAATAALATATAAAAAAATTTATTKATTTITTTTIGRVCKERVGISRHVTMRHVKTTETLKPTVTRIGDARLSAHSYLQ